MSTVNEAQPTTSTTATDLASYQQFALEQQAQNNAWSAQQAQKQMDFQKEMSNTAHQREVADLKAAGLNPILSANSGASVPNGASGDTDTSAAANVGNILQQVLQAQSAREVAGMYNAATIAAATIAADASMYATDVNNETKREYPDSIGGVFAKAIADAQHNNGLDTSWNPVAGKVSFGSKLGTREYALTHSILRNMNARSRVDFLSYLQKRGYRNLNVALGSGLSNFMKLYIQFAKSYRPSYSSYHRSKQLN